MNAFKAHELRHLLGRLERDGDPVNVVEMIVVDRATATHWLRSRPQWQRERYDPDKAHAVARMMARGEWEPRVEDPICFVGGELQDGQHRVAAVEMLAEPVRLPVCRDYKPTRADFVQVAERYGLDLC